MRSTGFAFLLRLPTALSKLNVQKLQVKSTKLGTFEENRDMKFN